MLAADGESESDYINANFVDGYKQKNAFISTQGPLPRTFGDFWKMVWEQMSVVIVMTTRAVERGRTKCGQYWPPDKGSSVTHEGFKIENLDVEAQPEFALTRLRVTNTKVFDQLLKDINIGWNGLELTNISSCICRQEISAA